jgi:hypothetical protein
MPRQVDVSMPDLTGQTIAGPAIIETLGARGFGATHKARQPVRNRLGMVNTNCRWATGAQTSASSRSERINDRFWWQEGQTQRCLQEKATKNSCGQAALSAAATPVN